MSICGQSVYMKRIHSDGKIVKSEHRVWDLERFFSAKIAEGQRDKDDRYSVHQITEQEFKNAK